MLDDLVLMYADKMFGGRFKEQLETIYDMQMVVSTPPVSQQESDDNLVIYKWSGPPVRVDR